MIARMRCVAFIVATFVLFLCLTGCHGHLVGFLNPKGIIAHEERRLLFDTLALMMIVVLPVIIMSIAFVYHYQVSHHIKDYKPNWGHSFFLEGLWWGIPCVIILILAIITWKKTYALDPYRSIPGNQEQPMLVQVIALPWKWLFIYPSDNIATINYLMLPVNKQVEFWITTDNVPMSAFFIPQLGSQIYTMTGMRTRLHLLATQIGTYDGMNTQYNGAGFSDMHFVVQVVTEDELQKWITTVKRSTERLTNDRYQSLLRPVINAKPVFYSFVEENLFNQVIDTYMHSIGTVHPRADLSGFQY